MAQKRELLEKLLIKLDEWANEKGSEWFKEELSNRYGKNIFTVSSNLENKIDFIQRYLMLDGLKCLDYSDVQEEVVRDQLIIDCIMMARYRAGKIDGKVNFEEFCRYAHMQSEELLNYFFSVRNKSNIELIKQEIKAFNSKAIFSPTLRFVGQINYQTKLFAASSMNVIRSSYSEFTLLSKVRNHLSHRDTLSGDESLEVENYLKHKDFDHLFQSLETLKNSLLSNVKIVITTTPKQNNQKSTFGDLPGLKNLKI